MIFSRLRKWWQVRKKRSRQQAKALNQVMQALEGFEADLRQIKTKQKKKRY